MGPEICSWERTDSAVTEGVREREKRKEVG